MYKWEAIMDKIDPGQDGQKMAKIYILGRMEKITQKTLQIFNPWVQL